MFSKSNFRNGGAKLPLCRDDQQVVARRLESLLASGSETDTELKLSGARRWLIEQTMTAATALDKQIERYRRMTGEQRLAVALELHELSCDIAREGIRRQNPRADAAEVERLLRHRLELARGA